MIELIFIILGLAFGVGLTVLVTRLLARNAPVTSIQTNTIAERVRSVGKLVALEAQAKEIATSTRGWSWLPPILLSQAKLAMIFHFEKRYEIDLSRLRENDVQQLSPTRFRVRLPEVEGALRLTEVTPYDIQAGRILGLIDVIQMDAPTQKKLMETAQAQAAKVYAQNEKRYIDEAKRSAERQLGAVLSLFGVELEFVWGPQGESRAAQGAASEVPDTGLALSAT